MHFIFARRIDRFISVGSIGELVAGAGSPSGEVADPLDAELQTPVMVFD